MTSRDAGYGNEKRPASPACLKLRIRVQGFVGIEIEIAIEIESFISAGHFSSIPIAIPISIWSFFSDKSGRLPPLPAWTGSDT